MKGYPKRVATKQDFIHLLADFEFKARALEDLKSIYHAADSTAVRVVSGSEETGDLVTEEIQNPMPLWKAKGFESRQEVAELIIENGDEI